MSMLAGLLPKLASLAVQPVVLAAGVATGVTVGAIGVGTGAIPVTDSPPYNAVLYECPGSGRIVTSIAPNQNVLVTARSADGQWLQIYVGSAGAERGWAPASSLQLRAAPESLPVEDCTPESTPPPASVAPTGAPTAAPLSAPPSVEPSALPSAAPSLVPTSVPPSASPTPEPSATEVATATPSPTPGPTSPGPYFSDFTIYDPPKDPSTGNYLMYPPGCTGYFTHAGMTVVVTDPDGVGAVFLYYQPSGAGSWSSVEMQWEGGNLYDAQISSDGTWGDGPVSYYITAWDSNEEYATMYGDADHAIVLEYCAD